MKIKTKIENKAIEVQSTLAIQAQAKYIKWLMKEEGIDYETALAIVEYRTDPIEYEYTLGYKLSDPVLVLAIFKQSGKNKRISAAENFAKTLRPEEAEIFWSRVFNVETAKKFKDEYKNAKKNRRESLNPFFTPFKGQKCPLKALFYTLNTPKNTY